jgi:ketosteroid isomerase-like protein
MTRFGAAVKEVADPLIEPDVEVVFVAWGQELMRFTGIDGLREGWLQWIAPWTSYYDEIEDVFAAGDDRVVVLGREHGHRLDADAEVAAESGAVYSVRDGRIHRVEYYAKQAEALEAVGLSE